MTQYNIEATITEHFFVDALDKDEAATIAEQQIIEGYNVLPSQVEIGYVKEIK